jgi:beta-glucosidase/6-phospho-beta-glucosidase/beta-galactosidase
VRSGGLLILIACSAGHNAILSHAHAVNIYRREYKSKQDGEIGITINGDWALPYDDSPDSKSELTICYSCN